MIMVLLTKVLELVASLVTTLAVALAATANWATLLVSLPVIVACLGAAIHYANRQRHFDLERRDERGATTGRLRL